MTLTPKPQVLYLYRNQPSLADFWLGERACSCATHPFICPVEGCTYNLPTWTDPYPLCHLVIHVNYRRLLRRDILCSRQAIPFCARKVFIFMSYLISYEADEVSPQKFGLNTSESIHANGELAMQNDSGAMSPQLTTASAAECIAARGLLEMCAGRNDCVKNPTLQPPLPTAYELHATSRHNSQHQWSAVESRPPEDISRFLSCPTQSTAYETRHFPTDVGYGTSLQSLSFSRTPLNLQASPRIGSAQPPRSSLCSPPSPS